MPSHREEIALKRLRAIIACALLLTLLLRLPASADDTWYETSAESGILMDCATGQVLWEKNPDERLAIASTTKIITALLAIESGRLDETVTIPPEAELIEGSKVYLTQGTTYTLRELLEALILESANDAAVAIAIFLGGSEEAFVRQMNEKARALGLTDTQFRNPHGLDEDGHYSSARDLARLGRVAMADPVYREIAGTEWLTFPWPEMETTREIYNRNLLIQRMPEATGVKNGYTEAALFTLVGSAAADGREVIGVLLGNPDKEQMYADMERLLRHGLYDFSLTTVLSAGDLPGAGGRLEEPLRAWLREGDEVEIAYRRPLPGEEWPEGTVAVVQALVDGRVIAHQPVLAPVTASAQAEPPAHSDGGSGKPPGAGAAAWYQRAGVWMATGAALCGAVIATDRLQARRRQRRFRRHSADRLSASD